MASPCRNPLPFPSPELDDDELMPEPPTYPIESLSLILQWMRHCEISGQEEKFVVNRFCISGFIGECTHCGEERIAPFTRGNSEAA